MTTNTLPALLPIFNTLPTFNTLPKMDLPWELCFEDQYRKVASKFDWEGRYESYATRQETLGLPVVHKSLADLIQADPKPYLHDLALWVGSDIFGTFEENECSEEFITLAERMYSKGPVNETVVRNVLERIFGAEDGE